MAAKKKTGTKTKAKAKAKIKTTKTKAKTKAKKTVKSTVKSFNSASLLAKTGKTWAEWFQILDDAGAAAMKRSEIQALLEARHAVTGWIGEMVTTTYELARDMQLKETAQGFASNVNRTLEASRDAAVAAWGTAAKRATVLGKKGSKVAAADIKKARKLFASTVKKVGAAVRKKTAKKKK